MLVCYVPLLVHGPTVVAAVPGCFDLAVPLVGYAGAAEEASQVRCTMKELLDYNAAAMASYCVAIIPRPFPDGNMDFCPGVVLDLFSEGGGLHQSAIGVCQYLRHQSAKPPSSVFVEYSSVLKRYD